MTISKYGNTFSAIFMMVLFSGILLLSGNVAAQLQISNIIPSQSSATADPAGPARIIFDRAVDPASITPASLQISGRYHGPYAYLFSLSGDGSTLDLTPQPGFIDGETIEILLTGDIQAVDGAVLAAPFIFEFRTANSQGDILGLNSPVIDINLFATDSQPAKIALGDFNGDGFIDAAVVNSSSNSLTILLNTTPANGFAFLEPLQRYDTGSTPTDLVIRDLDNDGNSDIAVVNFNSDDMTIFWGDGSGAFSPSPALFAGSRPGGIAAGDFVSGDGLTDLAISLLGEDKLLVFENVGERALSSPTELLCQESTFGLAAADFDGDGDPDLAAINNGAQSVSFFKNVNFGSWEPLTPIILAQRPVALQWENIFTANADGSPDNLPELVVLSSDLTLLGKNSAGSSAAESRFSILQFDGSQNNFVLPQEIIYNGTAQSFDLANLDRDRGNPDLDIDLILGDYAGNTIQFLQNENEQNWASNFNQIATAGTPRAIVTGDLDRDGDDDILFANHLENKLGLIISAPNELDFSLAIDSLINFGDVYVGDTAAVQRDYTPNTNIGFSVNVDFPDSINFDILPRNFLVQNGSITPIDFSFMPQDTGRFITIAAFTSTNPLQPDPATVILTGRGVRIDIEVVPQVLDFGTIPPGQTRTLDLTVRNNGNGDLILNSLQSSLLEFTHPGGPQTIGGNQSQNIPVTFAPTAEGAFRDTLFINSYDPLDPQIAVILIGNSQNLPDILVRDLQISDNPVFLNQTAVIAATVENLGTAINAAFTVSIFVDGLSVFDSTITSMQINESFPLQTTATFSRLGDIVVAVQADVANAIEESNEQNNRQEINVTVNDGQLVVRPNPFTPNGDSKNDQAVFNIAELVLSQPQLNIYDIAGRKIRSINTVINNQLSWDGVDNNGQEQLPGVYLYVLQDGSRSVAKGYVALAR